MFLIILFCMFEIHSTWSCLLKMLSTVFYLIFQHLYLVHFRSLSFLAECFPHIFEFFLQVTDHFEHFCNFSCAGPELVFLLRLSAYSSLIYYHWSYLPTGSLKTFSGISAVSLSLVSTTEKLWACRDTLYSIQLWTFRSWEVLSASASVDTPQAGATHTLSILSVLCLACWHTTWLLLKLPQRRETEEAWGSCCSFFFFFYSNCLLGLIVFSQVSVHPCAALMQLSFQLLV